MSSPNSSKSGEGAESAEEFQQNTKTGTHSFVEYELICNMTSFLEANGAEDLDKKVLQNMAISLTKRFNDTSPSTLQDVTMENPYGVGYRSPCVSLQPYQGSNSPAAQGRSVREFEEQMATLRKENFNLKLRLYFIEESIPGYKQANSSSDDTAMKQLIDTKVETAILRKEVQEKQDLLKEAAQAMNQMEKIQKETETKYQHIVEELNQKIQYLEMERNMEKSRFANDGNGELMNELLERSDIAENLNALQKIHELEGLLKQSDDKLMDFQQQIYSLEEILVKRDETIKEYEEKVKELVFQNNELLESIEAKDKQIANNERVIRGLRSKNTDLKFDNEKLMVAFKKTQANFSKELTNMQTYEQQMRNQQDVLSKMQSTISIKNESTTRLLERIQDYEKIVNKMNTERNIVKRENRFFRAIINKLQASHNCKDCYTFEKEEIYQKYEKCALELNKKNQDINFNIEQKTKQDYSTKKMQVDSYQRRNAEMGATAGGSIAAAYKLKQKFCLNICNNASDMKHDQTTNTSSICDNCSSDLKSATFNCNIDLAPTSQGVGDYLHNRLDFNRHFEVEIPIRYTFSDNSLCDAAGLCLTKSSSSCTSLAPTFSPRLLSCNIEGLEADFFLKAQQLRDELQKFKVDAADKTCMIQDLEEKLQNRDQLYDQARLTIKKLMLKNQKVENSRLKNSAKPSNVSNNEKEHKAGASVSGLECTGFCRSFSDTEALNDLTSMEKQKFDHIIQQQEATIKQLKSEVKKKTADLQNLVNKELWEKNREIERMNKILNKTNGSSVSPVKHNSTQLKIAGELQQSFSDEEYTKALQRNKLLQNKVDILLQRLDTERQNDALIAQLKTELQQARLDVESAENWRRQCTGLCATLSTRLEELAGFLSSLLKHKDVLGVLAVEKRKAMRRAVDRSLDLSKSLNMTLSVSGLSMMDQSLAELLNLSDILGGDMNVDFENKTFNSHEDIHDQSIEGLRAENNALKKELDKRRSADYKKERRSLPLSVMAENKESESEAWSEPDRKVSLARIGLEDHSTSLMAKELPLAVKNNETDSDYSDSNSRSYKARSQERISQLEQQIQQRDNRILEIQCQLVDVDNRLKKENLKVLEITQELKQLKKHNEELHIDLMAKEQEYQECLNRDYVAKNLYEECTQQLTDLQKQYVETQRSIESLQENEQELKKTLVETELASRNLQKQIDESTLRASKAATERVKALNDKLKLEKKVEELAKELNANEKERTAMQRQIEHLEQVQQSLHERLASGYTSEEVQIVHSSTSTGLGRHNVVAQQNLGEQRIHNSSPDLGIESDAGRVSSVELNSAQHHQLKTVEMSPSAKYNNNESADKGISSTENVEPSNGTDANANIQQLAKKHDCLKVEQENAELRRKLLRTKRAFEDTYEKLRNANKLKAQVEKDIKNQILKTHNVLKNVRSNMENEL